MANWILVLIAGWALGHLWPRGWLKALLAWRASAEERWAGAGAPAPAPAPEPVPAPAPAPAEQEPTGEQVVDLLMRMRRTPQDLERVAEALRAMTLELKQKRGE
jgi:hypothetical protein